MKPLKTSPALNAASAPATTGVWAGVPVAALVEQPDDRLGEHGADDRGRREQQRDLADPVRDRVGEARRSPRDASRESVGKSTVAIATENIPCGSM